MKKKTKIILSCLLGLTVIGGFATLIATQGENAQLSGVMNEDWVKTDTCIRFDTKDNGIYYSANDDDNISNIHFDYYAVNHEPIMIIRYDTDFYPLDDLEVYFVIYNSDTGRSYTTPINPTKAPRTDSIEIPTDIICEYYLDHHNCYIGEVWVRTTYNGRYADEH